MIPVNCSTLDVQATSVEQDNFEIYPNPFRFCVNILVKIVILFYVYIFVF